MKRKYQKKHVIALSDEDILAEVQKTATEIKSYHAGSFISHGAFLLVKECCQRFGRWPDVVRRFGVDPVAEKILDARVEMTEQQVLKEIMRFEMNGYSLSEKDISQKCPILLKSAQKHFLTWGLALKAAGIRSRKR
jgi:hypothetical protein